MAPYGEDPYIYARYRKENVLRVKNEKSGVGTFATAAVLDTPSHFVGGVGGVDLFGRLAVIGYGTAELCPTF